MDVVIFVIGKMPWNSAMFGRLVKFLECPGILTKSPPTETTSLKFPHVDKKNLMLLQGQAISSFIFMHLSDVLMRMLWQPVHKARKGFKKQSCCPSNYLFISCELRLLQSIFDSLIHCVVLSAWYEVKAFTWENQSQLFLTGHDVVITELVIRQSLSFCKTIYRGNV